MEKNFYIGLDIGTGSMGWAVTDENYNLMRKKGRDLWGCYLFDEAKTAAETRGYRTARRRLARTKHRLMLLQELFANEIAKVDMGFFARLDNSKYFIEDKKDKETNQEIKTLNVLFDDKSFTDKDYFKRFQTIFHLRNYLINNEITDIRFLYLGIHHIIKNRGHFLYSQDFDFSNSSEIMSDFFNISSYFSDNVLNTICFENFNEILDVLCNKKLTKTDKQNKILALTQGPKDKHLKELAKAMVGSPFSLNVLFNTKDFEKDAKLDFNKDTIESIFQEYEPILGDERTNVIISLKRILDFVALKFILGNHEFISESKVESYGKHHEDLESLKDYIKENCPEKYKLVFRRQTLSKHDQEYDYLFKKEKDKDKEDEKKDQKTKEINNYAKYIGMDHHKGFSKCTKEDFYNFLKDEIKVDNNDILSKIKNGTFLEKQRSAGNSIIPYQVHLHELKAILANAEKFFPFLKEVSDGMTVSEKIISLMTFRVPYYVGPFITQNYVGPFTTQKTKHSWMIKKEGVNANEKITPWNFDKVVDKDASEQEFIRRMTNKCTYLAGMNVLPKYSLLYSEYVVLNELSNLRVNGEKSLEVKQILFNLAKKEKKMTLKKCCTELIKQGIVPNGSIPENIFSGITDDLKGSLSSYIGLKNVLGECFVDQNREVCEDIILRITTVSDKDRLAEQIARMYGKLISDKKIKQLININCSKNGKLSKENELKKVLGEGFVYSNREMCENIILWITTISDKDRLAECIEKNYGKLILDSTIKRLKDFNYSQWGKFSKELLSETFELDSNGEYGNVSIIEALKNGTENFMELLSNRHGYSRAISLYNKEFCSNEVTYRSVEDLYCSPAVKRGIWNSIKLVKEIMKIEGKAPKKVFIEMTRGEELTSQKDNKKAKPDSRKKRLQELYDSLSKKDWQDLYTSLNTSNVDIDGEKNIKKNFLSNYNELFDKRKKDKIYLWFTQLGRDIYTGKPIEIKDIFNSKLYDIDHIYPQSKIKDDSHNNRVLVDRTINQNEKSDSYPLSNEIRTRMLSFWKILRKKKFISEEKYYRLTRSTALTFDECADFIDRQLVFTSITTKAVADLLKKLIGSQCEIVYSKARNVSDFRNKFHLIKLRELNDLHHAKDAFLNIVVGNIFSTKFKFGGAKFLLQEGADGYDLRKIFSENVPNAWNVKDKIRISEIYERNTCKVIRQTSEGKGKLFDATIKTASEGLIPLKAPLKAPLKEKDPISNTAKYGGYSGTTTAYFMLVKSEDNKGKIMVSLERVTVLEAINLQSKEDKEKYCIEKLKLINPHIISYCIKLNTLININGSYASLVGGTGNTIELHNEMQFILEKETVRKIKQVVRYQKAVQLESKKEIKLDDDELIKAYKINLEDNLSLFDILTNRLCGNEYRILSNRYFKIGSQLKEKRSDFKQLTLQTQTKLIIQILNIFQCKSTSSDLSLLGIDGKIRLRPPKNITGKNFIFITQSMTGFYKDTIDVQEKLEESL